jgi:sugar phosphate permease
MLILSKKMGFIFIAFYNAYGKNKHIKNMPMDRKKKKRFNGFSIFCSKPCFYHLSLDHLSLDLRSGLRIFNKFEGLRPDISANLIFSNHLKINSK